MQYTEADIEAVSVVNAIDDVVLGAGEKDTIEARIEQEYWFERDEYDSNEAFNKHVVERKAAQYQRGKEVLKHARLKTSTRFDSTLNSESAYAELERDAIAPVIRKFAGHIATSQQVHYVTLVLRKK